MKRIVMYLIIILLTVDAFSEISRAQIPIMGTQVGNDQWSQEDNITFKNIIDTTYGNKYFRFLIKQEGNLSFAWRQEPNNSEVILIVDNNGEKYIRRDIDWINPYIIPVDIGDNITFQFASMAKGNHTVWLAFPSQETKVIRPPSKPKINQFQDVELMLGNELCISANSKDPNNDKIDYSWDWGDGTPKSHSPGIPSGKDVAQCHYWEKEGLYVINVTASNSIGNSSSTINLTVLFSRPPEITQGERIGYININYTYSTKLNTNFQIENTKFLFNWDNQSETVANAEAKHSWSEPGTKMIKARALDIQGNPSNWSEPINVDIYIKKNIRENQDLQTEINNAINYTELFLIDSKYNVGELSIIGKDHLALKSSEYYASLSSNQDANIRLMLDNSSFINISGLSLEKTKYCLTIDNCSFCNINDCNLDFQCEGVGIGIKGKGYNTCENNTLKNRNQNNSSGILIYKSDYNLLKNNSINFLSPNNHYAHIRFINPHIGNRIIRTNKMEDLRIRMDLENDPPTKFIIIWEEGGASISDCTLNGSDNVCPDNLIDHIMNIIIKHIDEMELVL